MEPEAVIPASSGSPVFDCTVPPAAVVPSGAVVRFQTGDESYRRLAAGETLADIGHDRVNAVTGPLAVEGARPGDALHVDVLDVRVERAWVIWLPGFGHLGGQTDRQHVRQVPVADGRLDLGEGVTVPLAPMIGCVGLAPAEGVSSAVRPLYRLGGNLDLVELRAGATLTLPVEVEGALLSLGDLHAAQGAGEGAFVAVEAAGEATVRVRVEPGAAPPTPRVRLPGETIVVGLGTSHELAVRSAMEQAHGLLVERDGLAPETAYAVVCAAVSLRPAGPAGSLLADGLQGVLAVVPDLVRPAV